jgi:isoleucyl-tRNA synthetase
MEARWVPSFVQEKRFHNWLNDARDWCFSRSRYWGNPIPLWVSEDFEEVVCVGSIQELKDLSGVTEINDLHRQYIDHITIPSKMGKGVLRRVDEVFDCWFESGAMPYSQCHYPFSTNEEEFKKRFPADFIAEGLDQTRGWFYTLLVLGTGLFNKNPFKNLIVNGLVLDKEGKKLSKSKKNFTDPMELVHELGADALRMYLMNSPLVRAEPLRFKDEGVRSIIKEVFLPLFNAYRFFIQNAGRYESAVNSQYKFDPQSLDKVTNFMDKWIIASCSNLIKNFRHELENYKLYAVLPLLLKFLDNLTNWYVKLNRRRIKGDSGIEDSKIALDVLYDTLMNLNLLMAPFTPFLTESIYQNLVHALDDGHPNKQESIHFVRIPNYNPDRIDLEIEKAVHRMQSIIETGRKLRDLKKISLKTPTLDIKIIHRHPEYFESLRPVLKYISEELNTFDILYEQENPETVLLTAIPNNQVLGERLQKQFGPVRGAISKLSASQILDFERSKSIEVLGHVLVEGDLSVRRKYKLEGPDFAAGGDDDFTLVLNTVMNPALLQVGAARELINHVQKLRKSSGLNVDDEVVLYYEEPGEYYSKIMTENFATLEAGLRIPILPASSRIEGQRVVNNGEIHRDEETFKYVLCWKS